MEKKRSPSVGRTVWQTMQYLPRPWKKWFIRQMLPVPLERVPQLSFKIAETYEEIEEALGLVYAGYLERGLVAQNSAQLRLTKYHALPTSPILIAQQGREIVGTLTLILDSPLGMPLESLWNLDRFRQRYRRPAEVSSLAIKKPFRARRGEILFPLCKFMYMYAKHHLGVDLLLAAVSPSVQEFYRSILLFTPIDHRVLTYDFAQGARAVGLYLPLDGSEDTLWGNEYLGWGSRDYYSYFLDSHTPHFQFPERKFGETGQVILSPGLLEYLFRYCADIIDQLTLAERLALSNYYQCPEYQKILNLEEAPPTPREFARFQVLENAQIISAGQHSPPKVSIVDVSRSGVRIHSYQHLDLAVDAPLKLKIRLSPRQSVITRARVSWSSPERRTLGLRLLDGVPADYHQLIDYLEKQLHLNAQTGLPLALQRLAG